MNMKKKLLCFTLAAGLMLSGCNAKKNNDEVVAKVGDTNITMSEFEFYLNSVKQQMQGTELSSDEDWQTKDINGKKAIEVAKERALEAAAKNVSYKIIFDKLGNTISEDDKSSIKSTKDSIVKQYENAGGYEEFLKNSNITDSFIDMLCESMFCSDKLYNDFITDQTVSDEEIDKYYNDNYDLYFASYRRAKHVLILTKNMDTNEAYTDEQKAEAKIKAEEIYQRAQKGEDFDKLVEEYSEDPGSKSQPDGYTFTDGEMVQEFQDCVDSLNLGEIGFVESSFGYHIIKRLEIDKSVFREQIKSRILGTRFDDYIGDKMKEYGLEAVETNAIDKALAS